MNSLLRFSDEKMGEACDPEGRMNAAVVPRVFEILCRATSWLFMQRVCWIFLFLGFVRPAVAQFEGSEIGLDVVMEPGQSFAPGWILASPRYSGNLTYSLIIDSDGGVAHNALRPYEGWNFDQQPTGDLTWYQQFDASTVGWQVLDSGLMATEVVQNQVGQLDFHDVEFRTDGTVLLMGHENIDVTLTDSVLDLNDADRVVRNCILEEHDAEGNLTWLWRASNHIPALWCSSCNWTVPLLDAYHQNSFQTQENGNILLNLRNMDMVVMIDRQTDEVLWRLGGPESDFAFSNASDVFSQQHDAQMLNDHRILLFDNGLSGANGFARGVEYELDFEQGTVTLIDSWPHPDGEVASSQGSVQRLEDGGTLIGWGSATSDVYGGGMVSEFGPDGELRGTVYFESNHYSYRARKVAVGALPLRSGCSDLSACNYNPVEVLNTSCEFSGDACDDGNACTENDQIVNCVCAGTAVEVDPNASQCLDEGAVNFNPCPLSNVDDGSCLFQVKFRVDVSLWDSVPQWVTLSLGDNEPLLMSAGGFGTWQADVLLGAGVWGYAFAAEDVHDGIERSLDLVNVGLGVEAEVRACLGLDGAVCPGCTDPDDVAYSPFSEDDELCGEAGASGCTYPSAVNFDPSAFFEDGTCVFETADCTEDINEDGLIGIADILDLLTLFGTICD